MLSIALFKYQWEQRLRVLLKYCDTMCNRPFPPTAFWRTSVSCITQCLDLPDPGSLPAPTEYSSFQLHILAPSTPPSAPNDEPEDFFNLDDDPELQNEAHFLERLEINPEVAEETTNEEKDPSPSVPGINEPNSEPTPSTPTTSATNVALMDVTVMSDMEEDAPGPSFPANLQQNKEQAESDFWKNNPRPSDLPPIRMIFDAISRPEQSIEQQHPKIIWEETMKLHMLEHTKKVTKSLFGVAFYDC